MKKARKTTVCAAINSIIRKKRRELVRLARDYAPVLEVPLPGRPVAGSRKLSDGFWPTDVAVMEEMRTDKRGETNYDGESGGCYHYVIRLNYNEKCVILRDRPGGLTKQAPAKIYRGVNNIKQLRDKKYSSRYIDNPMPDGKTGAQRAGFWDALKMFNSCVDYYGVPPFDCTDYESEYPETGLNDSAVYWHIGGANTWKHLPGADERPRSQYGEFITIQYWMYYTYNNFVMKGPDWNHEGDWERISLEFRVSDIQELGSDAEPVFAYYGRHGPREERKHAWKSGSLSTRTHSGQLSWGGKHPVAFVAAGSHGNWPHCGTGKRNFPIYNPGGIFNGIIPNDTMVDCKPGGNHFTSDPAEGARMYPDSVDLDPTSTGNHRFCPFQPIVYGEPPCDQYEAIYELKEMPRRSWGCFAGKWGPQTTSPGSPMKQQKYYSVDMCAC